MKIPTITLKEFAELIGVHPQTVYRWVRTGRVKPYKVGSQFRFYEGDLENFIKGSDSNDTR